MENLLISKTDPLSFMGLIKASPLGQQKMPSFYGLINAGFVSILLVAALSHMARAAEPGENVIQSDNSAAICRLEACNMV